MFRHRQQLRRWAACMLLLWLFGVGAGIANACLAPNLAQLGGSIAAHASDEGNPHDGAPAFGIAQHHASIQAQPDESTQGQKGAAAKGNCTDFCDKASISIPSLKSALDDVQGHALPLAVVAFVLPGPAFVPMQLWLPRRDGVWAPPIPITFLRLTL